MQFQLPSNLKTQLIPYDPVLKALANSAKKSSSSKSKYPLGNPNDLIPNDIISQTQLQDAIDHINKVLAPKRYREFTRPVQQADQPSPEFKAILYYYEQCWYAAWLPPVGKESEYLFGYAYAYKDTNAAYKMVPHAIRSESQPNNIYKDYGRSHFVTYSAVMTKDAVINEKWATRTHYWNLANVTAYHNKSCEIRPVINNFEQQLRSTITVWQDDPSLFDRIRSVCIADVITSRADSTTSYNFWIDKDRRNWLPTADEIINAIKTSEDLVVAKSEDEGSGVVFNEHSHLRRTNGYVLFEENLTQYLSILHVIDTPFFRKWIQARCDKAVAIYQDPNNKTRQAIRQPWNQITLLFSRIRMIEKIWPNTPLDYYQTNIDVILRTKIYRPLGHYGANQWLNKHMPVASYFTLLNNFSAETIKLTESEKNWAYEKKYGLHIYSFRDFSDTYDMLIQVLETKDIAPPKRWRITEFHDYIQQEAWKIVNPNELLPQDLFPNPVKISTNDNQWTFFQPKDTHQLSQWGQAVRNCIGNASGYAEGVRTKKHFIVLCMIDNKPQFTVLLKVNNGMMTVDQIVSIANARLTTDQREYYTQIFGAALQKQEELLVSMN